MTWIFRGTAPVPSSVLAIDLSVGTYQDRKDAGDAADAEYDLSIGAGGVPGNKWRATVGNDKTGTSKSSTSPTVRGGVASATFSRASVAKLKQPFYWEAQERFTFIPTPANPTVALSRAFCPDTPTTANGKFEGLLKTVKFPGGSSRIPNSATSKPSTTDTGTSAAAYKDGYNDGSSGGSFFQLAPLSGDCQKSYAESVSPPSAGGMGGLPIVSTRGQIVGNIPPSPTAQSNYVAGCVAGVESSNNNGLGYNETAMTPTTTTTPTPSVPTTTAPPAFTPGEGGQWQLATTVSPDENLLGTINEVDGYGMIANAPPDITATAGNSWVSQDPNNPTWYLFALVNNGIAYVSLVQGGGDDWNVGVINSDSTEWSCSNYIGIAVPPTVFSDFALPPCNAIGNDS